MDNWKRQSVRGQIVEVFEALSLKIEEINIERRNEGGPPVPQASARLLGQVSLLVHEKASLVLSLNQTGDLDALLNMDHLVKEELKRLLKERGYAYDEDSYLIWIPAGARFEMLLDLGNVVVESIDPESALVSKAVKDPRKNRQLIRDAIASETFPTLVSRILENGGRLEDFG